MTYMNIFLPEGMKAFIESQMAAESHASAGEYLRTLIRDAQKQRAKQELETKLLEGLEGHVVEMALEDWDSIEREARERFDREQARP